MKCLLLAFMRRVVSRVPSLIWGWLKPHPTAPFQPLWPLRQSSTSSQVSEPVSAFRSENKQALDVPEPLLSQLSQWSTAGQ